MGRIARSAILTGRDPYGRGDYLEVGQKQKGGEHSVFYMSLTGSQCWRDFRGSRISPSDLFGAVHGQL